MNGHLEREQSQLKDFVTMVANYFVPMVANYLRNGMILQVPSQSITSGTWKWHPGVGDSFLEIIIFCGSTMFHVGFEVAHDGSMIGGSGSSGFIHLIDVLRPKNWGRNDLTVA